MTTFPSTAAVLVLEAAATATVVAVAAAAVQECQSSAVVEWDGLWSCCWCCSMFLKYRGGIDGG